MARLLFPPLKLFQRFSDGPGQRDPGQTKIFRNGQNFVDAESDTDGVPDIGRVQDPVQLDSDQDKKRHQSFLHNSFRT